MKDNKDKSLCYCLKCNKNFYANKIIAKRIKQHKEVIIFCVFCGCSSDIIHYKNRELQDERRTMEKWKNTECISKF
jgi:hypothetical protein